MKKDYILVVIVLFILIVVAALALIMDNTFEQGDISFQQPDNWNKELVFGSFDNNSTISQVIYKKSGENKNKEAYIMLKLMKKDDNKNNSIREITILSNSNYSVKNSQFNNNKVKEYSKTYKGISEYVALIENDKYDITLEAVSPSEYSQETEEEFNKILKTLVIH